MTRHIVICDQDCIVGDMLIYVLQKSNCKITRLKGSASQLSTQLLKCSADLLIANAGPDVEAHLHILKCCRTKYPQQKQILITAVFSGIDALLEEEKISVLYKPFTINQLHAIIRETLPEIEQDYGRKQKFWIKCKQHVAKLLSFIKLKMKWKNIVPKIVQLWRSWLLKKVESERLQAFKSAYKFCLSKFANPRHVLELWLYLEYLERRYLLAKRGADVEHGALQFYYTVLKGKLERSTNGLAVSLKGGDGLGPELDSAQFARFYSRLKNEELSFGCFMQAAQARLVRWASSRPSVGSIRQIIKKAAASPRKTPHWQSLSDKIRTAEAKVEIELLASADECSLREVFQQAWC